MSSDVFYKAARTMAKASQISIPMNDAFAEILKSLNRPASAMKLIKTELRRVFIPPPKLENV